MGEQEVQVPQVPGRGEPVGGAVFTWLTVMGLIIGTVILLGAANVFTRIVQKWAESRWGVPVDRPQAWPFSVFSARVPSWYELLLAAAVAVFFLLARRYLLKTGFRLPHVLLVGIVLVVGTNLVQGWQNGLVTPTSGTIGSWKENLADPFHTAARLTKAELTAKLQYYDDAQNVSSAYDFLARFNDIQPHLLTHSRTHPPGAVLVFYTLKQLVGSPAAISLAIAILATVLSGLFYYGLLRTLRVEGHLAGYTTFLFLLLPAVQIYYAASLDALIASLLLGALYLFVQSRGGVSVAGATCVLIGASFLTFGWVFILPVLLGWEVLQRRIPWRLIMVCAAIGLFYVGLHRATGFDYLQSFRTASAIENAKGFYLAAEPVSYVLTRLECIAEILAYLGPFLLVLMMRGLRRGNAAEGPALVAGFHGQKQPGHGTRHDAPSQDNRLQHVFWLGVGTLLAMFAAGAFRTGETARACLFIYPYLLLPVAVHLRSLGGAAVVGAQILLLVFLQALLMQTFGSFFW